MFFRIVYEFLCICALCVVWPDTGVVSGRWLMAMMARMNGGWRAWKAVLVRRCLAMGLKMLCQSYLCAEAVPFLWSVDLINRCVQPERFFRSCFSVPGISISTCFAFHVRVERRYPLLL